MMLEMPSIPFFSGRICQHFMERRAERKKRVEAMKLTAQDLKDKKDPDEVIRRAFRRCANDPWMQCAIVRVSTFAVR